MVVFSAGHEIVSHYEYPNEYRNNLDRNITINLGFDQLVKLRVVDFYIEKLWSRADRKAGINLKFELTDQNCHGLATTLRLFNNNF